MSEPAVYLIDHDEPKEWPMLLSAPMVLALLDGRKTMTRRIVSPQNSLVNGWPTRKRSNGLDGWPDLDLTEAWLDKGPSPAGNAGPYLKVPGGDESVHRVYSRVHVGDRLWCKETFLALSASNGEYIYRADMTGDAVREERELKRALPKSCRGPHWKPSIFMPRGASRITLEVTSVRPEHVQDISEVDAKAEGTAMPDCSYIGRCNSNRCPRHSLTPWRNGFESLWQSINGKRAGCDWASNPWVWVIEFRRIAHKEDTTSVEVDTGLR